MVKLFLVKYYSIAKKYENWIFSNSAGAVDLESWG
jgi:hypothetical protein